jgi:hypothetical protein
LRAAATLLVTMALTPSARAELLACPAGTKLEQMESAELAKRVEVCVDEKTGREEGPGRSYNLNGEMLTEFMNRAGEQTSLQFTQAGARDFLVTLNATLDMMRMPARMHEVDPRTLRFDITADPPDGEEMNAKTVMEDLKDDPYTCMLLRLPGGPYEIVNVRYQRTDGSVWLELPVRREDCKETQTR